MQDVERILWKEKPLATIIRARMSCDRTTFLTPEDFRLQMGFVVYPKGGQIPRHAHKPLERKIVGTSEALLVRKGRCEVDIYNAERQLVATREISAGDILLLIDCGHGFRMLEDTVLLELKQGPYTGLDEKEHF